MFRSILIANRGEIAVRIIRACRNMGIKSIAVYSKEDKDSLHVQLADRRVCIGEGPAKNSYLNMERIISAAKNTDADAIHPGFGFLSENADFVRLCKENDIAFIGPSAEVIDSMGNKSNARKTMMEAGVPVVPGTKEPVYDAVTGEKLADEIGYPVMIKASSGGGGKGMRVSKSKEDFEFNFNTAQRESANAFGDDTMYIEKFIENPRHVEIQIMADEHGNVVALGERDCSVQRNHNFIHRQLFIERDGNSRPVHDRKIGYGPFVSVFPDHCDSFAFAALFDQRCAKRIYIFFILVKRNGNIWPSRNVLF